MDIVKKVVELFDVLTENPEKTKEFKTMLMKLRPETTPAPKPRYRVRRSDLNRDDIFHYVVDKYNGEFYTQITGTVDVKDARRIAAALEFWDRAINFSLTDYADDYKAACLKWREIGRKYIDGEIEELPG